MKAMKKIISTIAAIALVTAYPLSAYAFTPVDSGHGTFANETISGTGPTVFMFNHYGSYKKCRVNIFDWGIFQTGKVKFDLYRANGGLHWYHTFEDCDEYYLMDVSYFTNSLWTLDAQCTATSAHRTIDGEWEMS